MRVALDSNVLVYLAGGERSAQDKAKIERIRTLLARLPDDVELVAPVQTLGELFVVMRRAGASPARAREALAKVAEEHGTPVSTKETALAAADLVVDHKLQFWDAMILAAAADAGCALLLSEDMQHGFLTRGVTVVNPFVEPMHARLADVLET